MCAMIVRWTSHAGPLPSTSPNRSARANGWWAALRSGRHEATPAAGNDAPLRCVDQDCGVSDWQIEFLESCGDLVDGTALGEGAFTPGTALWVGRREIAHFDQPRTLDIRLTKAGIRAQRDVLENDPRVTLRKSQSDWIEVAVESDTDLDWARQLVAEAIAANLPTAPSGTPPKGTDLDRRRRFH